SADRGLFAVQTVPGNRALEASVPLRGLQPAQHAQLRRSQLHSRYRYCGARHRHGHGSPPDAGGLEILLLTMRKRFFCLLALWRLMVCAQPVEIQVEAGKKLGALTPIWSFFGYDEPNYTYMKDGKKLLSEIAALSPVPVYVRTHSLLVTGDGVAALKW